MKQVYLQELLSNAANHLEPETLEIIERFKPLLRKYARLLRTEDADDELQMELLKVIYETSWDKLNLKNEGAYVNYIATAIRNAYINLSKTRNKHQEYCFSSFGEDQEFMVTSTLTSADDYEHLLGKELKNIFTETEFRIVCLTCLKGYSCAVIAKKQGVSRQHINQVKRRALGKLKQYFKANSDEQE